jgi:hypothetical protein
MTTGRDETPVPVTTVVRWTFTSSSYWSFKPKASGVELEMVI